jgi:hypothetical protein
MAQPASFSPPNHDHPFVRRTAGHLGPVSRWRTFRTAFWTASQAWWWRVTVFTNMAVCVTLVILWFTHSVTSLIWAVWGLILLSGLAAVWIKTFICTEERVLKSVQQALASARRAAADERRVAPPCEASSTPPVFLLGAGSLVSGRRVWALGLGSA